MSLSEISERTPIFCKRNGDTKEFGGSSIKRTRLGVDDDDSDVLLTLTRSVSPSSSSSSSSSLPYPASDEEDNHRSTTTISSGSSSIETITTNGRLTILDLKAHQISETETFTLITNNFRKEESPINENLGETAEMDSETTERKRDQGKTEKTQKSPTQAELDEFFSTAEKYEQKRFTEKYNYDIVNDTPLEGRYQWVSLKP